MDTKWIYLVVIDIIILTNCKPGRVLHDPHKTDGKPPWSHGDWGSHDSHGWDGHPWGYDWDHDYTTHRTRSKGTTTLRIINKGPGTTTEPQRSADAGYESPTSTHPQPTIREVDIRFGEMASVDTTPSSNLKPLIQAAPAVPTKTEDDGGPPYSEPEFITLKEYLSKQDKEDKLNASISTESDEIAKNTEDIKDNSDNLDLTPGIRNGSIKVDSLPTTTESVDTDGSENSKIDVRQDNKWHVGIYEKELSRKHLHKVFIYKYKCGGSLIKANMVISAGHCFWSPKWHQQSTSDFEAAAGKMYREWDDPRDQNAQYTYLKKVTITPMTEPCRLPDLAVVTVDPAFVFDSFVKPVCISFEEVLEYQQLRRGSDATIASSASVDSSGACQPSDRIHWLSLPYVDVKTCSNNQILLNRLSHRICARDANNETQCESNRGNGLVFLKDKVPYLRGVASFVSTDSLCMKYNTTSFTNLGAAKSRAKLEKIKTLFDSLIFDKCEDFYKDTEPVTEGQDSDYGDFGNGGGYGIQSIGSLPVPGLNGTSAPAFQWHVGVYSKNWSPYMQICGGTIVKRDYILSAAHCFWDSHTGLQSSTRFAVAGGKLYRPWDDSHDTYAQQSDVSDIIVPVRFRGSATSFQDDIAILRLKSPFTYALGVQPACLDFTTELDKEHLQPGTEGTVAGWGLTEENGVPSQRLNYLKLPYVDLDECFAESDPAFHKYITSDKVCAGSQVTGQALCRGDSGGGLVISDPETPYLRGIASTAANNDNLCNAYTLAAFTHVYAHRSFIRDHVPDVERECELTYSNRVHIDIKPGYPTKYKPGDDIRDPVTGIIGPATSIGIDADKKTRFPTKYKPGEDIRDPASGIIGPATSGSIDSVGGLRGVTVRADTTPSYLSVPYNHFVCNCNCNK